MKELLQKFFKGCFYLLGGTLILASLGILFSGGGIITALLSLIFGAMIFPPVYKILKEKVFLQKLQISFSKFISLYSAIIFFGYVISFSLSASSLPTPIDTTNNNLSQNTEISQTIDNASNKENTAKISEEEKLKIEEEKKQQQELVKQQKLEQEENRIKAAKERLNKELEGVRSFDGSGYRDSVDVIIIEVAVFGAYAQIIEEYINDSNEEIKSLAQQLKTEVSKLQSKEFPQIRKAYTDLLGKALWVSNVDVSSKGTYNGTIEFVGGILANNQNKLDMYNEIKDTLKSLRFDRANFKWYEYDDSYTYWEVESLPDSEVSKIVE